MNKNFKARLLAVIALLAIACLSIPFFDSLPFKIFYAVFAFIAAIELFSFFKVKTKFELVIMALCQATLLVVSTVFIFRIHLLQIILMILGVCGYDVFAYLFGGMLGGKIIKKSRPFPHISKNKTWEGTFFGLLTSILLVLILLLAIGSLDFIYLLCGPLAVIGDLSESLLKRRFGIKDSSEIVVKNKIFDKFEILVGGRGGHGGYLDRIDSMSFTGTVLLILLLLV